MRTKMLNLGVMSIYAVVSSVNTLVSIIQDAPPEPQKAPGPPPPGLVVPIDSDIIYLLLLGIALGIGFLRVRKT